MLLTYPGLDLRTVFSDTGDTTHRVSITASMLEIAARTDVAVGVGVPLVTSVLAQSTWVGSYRLRDPAES